MGTPTEEQTPRNKKIYQEYKAGTPMLTLIKRYDISSQRIFQIVHRYEEKYLSK